VRTAPGQSVIVRRIVPARDQQQRHQYRGQHHQRQRDPVDAQDVSGAERRDPVVVLDELIGRPPGSKRTASVTAMTSTTTDTATPRYLANSLAPAGNDDQHGAQHRHGPQQGQERRIHHRFTATTMATTRAAPASIDKA
jgi:hypothetical protein